MQNRWREQYSRGRGGMTQQRYLAPAMPDVAKQQLPPRPRPSRLSPPPPSRWRMSHRPTTRGCEQSLRPGGSRARAYSMSSEAFYYQTPSRRSCCNSSNACPPAAAGVRRDKKLETKADTPGRRPDREGV